MPAAQETWTIRAVLNWSMTRFQEKGFPTPLLDAQLLLAHAIGCGKMQLYLEMERPLSEAERGKMRELVKRRLAHEPVAYLLGGKQWHDLDLFVDGRVLIPRPETETLLDLVLALAQPMVLAPKLIFDLCTGSGCLAIALARRFPEAEVLGVDVSEQALEVAKRNAASAGVPQVQFLLGDLSRAALYPYLRKQFGVADICVANPPYVTDAEWDVLDPGVRQHEPRIALVGGVDGLGIARTIWKEGRGEGLWAEDGIFAMELAQGQPLQLLREGTLDEAALEVVSPQAPALAAPVHVPFIARDYEGKERFLFTRGPNAPQPEAHALSEEPLTT